MKELREISHPIAETVSIYLNPRHLMTILYKYAPNHDRIRSLSGRQASYGPGEDAETSGERSELATEAATATRTVTASPVLLNRGISGTDCGSPHPQVVGRSAYEIGSLDPACRNAWSRNAHESQVPHAGSSAR